MTLYVALPPPRLYHSFSLFLYGEGVLGLFLLFLLSVHRIPHSTIKINTRQISNIHLIARWALRVPQPLGSMAIWALNHHVCHYRNRISGCIHHLVHHRCDLSLSLLAALHILIDTTRHRYGIIIGRGRPFFLLAPMINSKFRGW
jgi:hypothetical protein